MIDSLKQNEKVIMSELNDLRNKNTFDYNQLLVKIRERDSEIMVLKEMVKGVQLEVKAKEMDIKRLGLKINRQQKIIEMREGQIQHVAHNIKNSVPNDANFLLKSLVKDDPSQKLI